jgi:magnesium-transporting ATPase (P-type)
MSVVAQCTYGTSMSSTNQTMDYFVFVKGAPEAIYPLLCDDDSKPHGYMDVYKVCTVLCYAMLCYVMCILTLLLLLLLLLLQSLAKRGLRVLAMAYRKLSRDEVGYVLYGVMCILIILILILILLLTP